MTIARVCAGVLITLALLSTVGALLYVGPEWAMHPRNGGADLAAVVLSSVAVGLFPVPATLAAIAAGIALHRRNRVVGAACFFLAGTGFLLSVLSMLQVVFDLDYARSADAAQRHVIWAATQCVKGFLAAAVVAFAGTAAVVAAGARNRDAPVPSGRPPGAGGSPAAPAHEPAPGATAH
jgi:hypothetical protein